MPAEKVAMRQAREIIRLKFSDSLTTREIARRLDLAPSTVRETLKRLESAELTWPFALGHRTELIGESMGRTRSKQNQGLTKRHRR